MNLDYYNKNDLKTLPPRKKMLSEWIFPIHQSFSPKNSKREKIAQKYKSDTLVLTKYDSIDFPIESNCERVQTFITNSQVQIQENPKAKNSFYGGFLHKISNKHANVYRKRLPALDVANVNQLNITSYRSFRIGSSNKRPQDKQKPLKDAVKLNGIKANSRVLSFSSPKMKSEDKLPKIEYVSSLQKSKKIKIKWQKSENLFQLLKRPEEEINQKDSSRIRKNSICPWENFEQ